MRFGHYWPKDPAKERIEHLRRPDEAYWQGCHELMTSLYSMTPLLRFEQFSVGGDDGRDNDTPEARARAVQRVRDAALGGVCGTVRHLP